MARVKSDPSDLFSLDSPRGMQPTNVKYFWMFENEKKVTEYSDPSGTQTQLRIKHYTCFGLGVQRPRVMDLSPILARILKFIRRPQGDGPLPSTCFFIPTLSTYGYCPGPPAAIPTSRPTGGGMFAFYGYCGWSRQPPARQRDIPLNGWRDVLFLFLFFIPTSSTNQNRRDYSHHREENRLRTVARISGHDRVEVFGGDG
ncbi:hypothetical protein C8J57DRAFT_1211950 [Mycena rebaudengoi]|nr:hypothetical protein C8J57DRAFT_1211950 [Mycena rebaudengoi]